MSERETIEKIYKFMSSEDRTEEEKFFFKALLKLEEIPWSPINNMRLSNWFGKKKDTGISRMTYYRKLNQFHADLQDYLYDGEE